MTVYVEFKVLRSILKVLNNGKSATHTVSGVPTTKTPSSLALTGSTISQLPSKKVSTATTMIVNMYKNASKDINTRIRIFLTAQISITILVVLIVASLVFFVTPDNLEIPLVIVSVATFAYIILLLNLWWLFHNQINEFQYKMIKSSSVHASGTNLRADQSKAVLIGKSKGQDTSATIPKTPEGP